MLVGEHKPGHEGLKGICCFKFGAKTLLDLMIFTGNIEPLRFMANILGYEVVKRGKDAEGNGK